MEDDDEFGDLYTDVLTPFSDPTPFLPPPPPRSEPLPPPIDHTPAASISRPSSDDVLPAASTSKSQTSLNLNLNLNPTINLNDSPPEQNQESIISPSSDSEDPPLPVSHEFRGVSLDSPSGPSADESETRVLESLSTTEVAAANHEGDEKLEHSAASVGVDSAEKGDNWGGAQVEQEDDVPVIPGISISQPNEGALNLNGVPQEEANDQGDDWDSDSEDDLQIVLNENLHPDIHHYQGGVAMGDNGGKVDDDDEDEDGDPLVIVTDIDAVHHHPPPEEQGWGEDSGQAPDGEGKETGEAGKSGAGVSMPAKGGYNSYGYHQYHSQFKYVRPGAAPLPGGPGGPGGPGQVRPPVNMGAVGGRGRGDWRPVGMKGPVQKGFQSGFWGSNASGRGGFGADFTLPSQKTIFDISIDSFEEKPWNQPGADVSDYFNFGLNEDTWKEYCKKLEHLRMESTMKSKAHVLVVGSHSEQEYDPDLPPELAAAAAGFQDPSAGNSNTLRADGGQIDVAKGSNDMRPVLPTGRPIQVETGGGERIPSIDTRPPRMRDPDSVIEIVLQDSFDDGASRDEDGAAEDGRKQTGNSYSDGSAQSLDRSKDNARRRSSQGDMAENESSLPPESPIELSSSSKDKSPSDKLEASHGERRMKGKIQETSRSTSPVQSAPDRKFVDEKQEVSNENIEGSASPQGLSFEERVFSDDEPSETEGIDPKEKDDAISNENSLGSSKHHSTRKLKSGSQVDHVEAKETDDLGYTKAARSSDNSRATGSSQDLQKRYDVADDEGVQDEHSSRARDLSRNRRGDVPSHNRKDRDDVTKRKPLHRDSDPYPPHSSHVKPEGFDRRRERDYQQGGEDPYGRKYRGEDSRKNVDGIATRHRGKVREGERGSKDEFLPPRKPVENGNWKDAGFRTKEKDVALNTRVENMDDPHRKRRKDNFQQDEILRAHRKREESLDQRKRDEHRPIRSKDESWFQRERPEQRHRERESVPRREREDGRASSIRNGRIPEEKGRSGHSRKDNFKGHERDGPYKETGRNGELGKRKDRAEDASTHYGYEEKRSRQEKPVVRIDRANVIASDNQRAHDRRPKENSRRPKQLEGASNSLKKLQEDKIGRDDMAGLTGTNEEGNGEKVEEASDDVDQHHRSKRGRSKLERWGSHHDVIERDDPAKKTQLPETSLPANEALKEKEPDSKHTESRHLDTVAKLKKRSERFKLPMPIEKDTSTIKKMEAEPPLPSNEAPSGNNSEMKSERPPRKRRWISN